MSKLKNIDIVISGGADDLLANPGDRLVPVPNSPGPVGPYPLILKDSTGKDIPLVTTQGEYRYVGRLTVDVRPERRHRVHGRHEVGPGARLGRPRPSRTTPPKIPTLKAKITDPLVAYKANLAANVIGTTDVLLDGGNPNPIRQKESNLGDLVADAFLAGANRTAVADGRPVAKVAFSNGGGIRNSIAAGNITEKSTFDVLPFDNVLVTVPGVTPAKFKELMEWGVAALRPGGANGKFPQIAGFRIDGRHDQAGADPEREHGDHAGSAHHVADARGRHADRQRRPGRRRRAERQPRHDELHRQQRGQLPVQWPDAVRRGRAVPAGALRLHPQRSRPAYVTATDYPVATNGRIIITP